MLDKYSSTEIGSQEAELQEYFKIAIPRLLDYIEEHKITHILLLEKAARLFKVPLILLFSQLWLNIKVWSYAPDYFEIGEGFLYKRLQKKKLKFLPSVTDWGIWILVLDDFSVSGRSLNKAVVWLRNYWYSTSQVHSVAFSWF